MHRICLLAALIVSVIATTARAGPEADGTMILPTQSAIMTSDVPDPSFCSVVPADAMGGLLLAPLEPSPVAASVVTVTVRNNSNAPMAGAIVVVQLQGTNVRCGSTEWSGTTNASGQVVLTLGGGGCSSDMPQAAFVKANGITIRIYENVKSPDFDGSGGNLEVDLADLLAFSAAFVGESSFCHDYDNNGTTGLSDLIVFSPAFRQGNHCDP